MFFGLLSFAFGEGVSLYPLSPFGERKVTKFFALSSPSLLSTHLLTGKAKIRSF
jgi:hypothetical protein